VLELRRRDSPKVVPKEREVDIHPTIGAIILDLIQEAQFRDENRLEMKSNVLNA